MRKRFLNRYKKFISLILVCFISVNCLSFSVFADVTEGKLKISDVTTKAGDSVDIDIELLDNPGFISANLYVKYDENVLKLTKVTDGGILSGASHSDSYTSPYGLCWMNDLATENIKANGILATLTFKVKNSNKTETSITIEQDVVDYKLDSVFFEVSGGGIKLNSNSNPRQNSQSKSSGNSDIQSQNDEDNLSAKENIQNNQSQADYGQAHNNYTKSIVSSNQREIDSTLTNSNIESSEQSDVDGTHNNQIIIQSEESNKDTKSSTSDTANTDFSDNSGFLFWIIVLIVFFLLIGMTVITLVKKKTNKSIMEESQA